MPTPARPAPAEEDDDARRDSGKTRSGRARANPRAPRSSTRAKENAELARVKAAVAAIPVSAPAAVFRKNRRQSARERAPPTATVPAPPAERFGDLPLSTRTRDALAAAGFDSLTPVQRAAVPQALAGRDVLAAAPTGSGKTLAFLVPLVEALWRARWGTEDALGAIVLAPTRELAIQIFQVLRRVAHFHGISAGLVIGGKDFEGEQDRVGVMNVLVATPGRLLHHLDTVADIDCNMLQMLVLDEADRILDLGFEKTLDAILEHLPNERQTLLFSATQTKSIKQLARLSLRSPQYVAVQARTQAEVESETKDADTGKKEDTDGKGKSESAAEATNANEAQIVGTPMRLSQSYAEVASHDKLGVLWSFLRTHLRSKIIVFFATGKQVRFAFETFCKLRPGMSLLHIHGNMKQLRRTDMYEAFSRTKNAALFATDVASRGLDFPNVDWVVQADCPEDVATYVHRVGRTARFRSNGRAMLFLGPGKEAKFLDRLQARGITPNKVRINPARMAGIAPRIAATVASNKELKMLAQRAFLFYLKSVCQQSDKDVFDAAEHDASLLAKSFGLAVTPVVTFRGKNTPTDNIAKHAAKTVFGYRPRQERESQPEGDMETETKTKKRVAVKKEEEEEDDDDDILQVKRVHAPDDAEDGEALVESGPTKRKRKRMKLDHVNYMASVNRTVFDEDGNAKRASEIVHASEGESDAESDVEKHENMDEYADAVAKRLEVAADADKLRERERVRAKHARQKDKRRSLNKVIKPNADIQQQTLKAAGEHSDGEDSSGESDAGSDSDSSSNSSDGGEDEGQEELALKILASRNK